MMGKSAVGKDTIYKELLKRLPELERMVSCTTRPMREGEKDGREYRFLSEAELEAYRSQGRLIELRRYQTASGIWTYATADDGSVDLSGKRNYLGIGTLESFRKLRAYYGDAAVVPVYIEVEAGARLERALQRERKQAEPRYDELCRRYLADEVDFSEKKLREAGIKKRYENSSLERCLADIVGDVINYVQFF